ncbi:MAG: hypothetical protein AAF483_22765 [Planctomycetota bacterium]
MTPSSSSGKMVRGEDAAHDLRLFADDITDSLNLKVEEASEPVHTVDELSRMFNVPTKTSSRETHVPVANSPLRSPRPLRRA